MGFALVLTAVELSLTPSPSPKGRGETQIRCWSRYGLAPYSTRPSALTVTSSEARSLHDFSALRWSK